MKKAELKYGVVLTIKVICVDLLAISFTFIYDAMIYLTCPKGYIFRPLIMFLSLTIVWLFAAFAILEKELKDFDKLLS